LALGLGLGSGSGLGSGFHLPPHAQADARAALLLAKAG